MNLHIRVSYCFDVCSLRMFTWIMGLAVPTCRIGEEDKIEDQNPSATRVKLSTSNKTIFTSLIQKLNEGGNEQRNNFSMSTHFSLWS
jgi:hypothetical protein